MKYLMKQIPIALCIYIGQSLVGFGLGWTAPMIPKLRDPDQTPLPQIITDGEASWIGSVLYIGTIIGPHITGYLSNILGRKPCLLLGGSLVSLSFVVLAVARNLSMIITGRIIIGFGTGVIFVVNLVYIGEIASTKIRGVLLSATGIFGTLGTLIVYSVGPYFSYRTTQYVGLAISCSYLVAIFFIPETPLFNVMKGEEEKAKEILLSLGREEDINSIVIATKAQIAEESSDVPWKQLFTVKSNRKALFITLSLGIFQQLSGAVAVIFFATDIFILAGSSINPNIATIIIGVTQIGSSIVAPIFIEFSGRKVLLLVSTAVCTGVLTILGIYFYLYNNSYEVAEDIAWLPLVTLIIFFLAYDMGFGIIPGTLTGELFQTKVRSMGSAVTVTTAWLVGFGVATAFGYMVAAIGGHTTFWIFAAACASAFVFTILFVPETKGKSLLQISEMLSQ